MTWTYWTVKQASQAEYKDRGSRFIAYAKPIYSKTDFVLFMRDIKALNPKASHFCYAYRLGTTNSDIIEKSGDDGEPNGSAGKPILNQILSKGLTFVGIIVVRYFGGTLLGIPGLINAYKNASSVCLQTAFIVEHDICNTKIISIDYSHFHDVQILLKKHHVITKNVQQGLFCCLQVDIPLRTAEAFMLDVKNHIPSAIVQ